MDDRSNFVLVKRDRKAYLKAKYLERHEKPASHGGAEG
jgi:hypothetical protein